MSPRSRHPRRQDIGEHVHDPQYYDFMTTHPEFESTELLMRVYEALEERGIPFRYSYPIGDSLATAGLREHITVHFYIPEINTCIIVQGGFWFNNANRLQDTALTIALLEYGGYRVLWWSEPEILAKGLDRIIDDEPLFHQVTQHGAPLRPTDYQPLRYGRFYRRPPRPVRAAVQERKRMRRYPKR